MEALFLHKKGQVRGGRGFIFCPARPRPAAGVPGAVAGPRQGGEADIRWMDGGIREEHRLVFAFGPPARCHYFHRFFLGGGFNPTRIDVLKKFGTLTSSLSNLEDLVVMGAWGEGGEGEGSPGLYKRLVPASSLSTSQLFCYFFFFSETSFSKHKDRLFLWEGLPFQINQQTQWALFPCIGHLGSIVLEFVPGVGTFDFMFVGRGIFVLVLLPHRRFLCVVFGVGTHLGLS